MNDAININFGNGTMTGYLITFSEGDDSDETFFSKRSTIHIPGGESSVPLIWQTDPSNFEPIGMAMLLDADEIGVRIKAKIADEFVPRFFDLQGGVEKAGMGINWSPVTSEPVMNAPSGAITHFALSAVCISAVDLNELPDEMFDFGSCCACGKSGDSVRNLLMLPYKAPIAKTGWGCMICGLEADGAMAVLCDICLAGEHDLKEVIVGAPADNKRMPYTELGKEPHVHDLTRHEDDDLPTGLPVDDGVLH